MTAWTSPHTADPAHYGLAPVEIVKFDGRRFRLVPPRRTGEGWTWGECGAVEVYAARSMRNAEILIAAKCNVERRGLTFTLVEG